MTTFKRPFIFFPLIAIAAAAVFSTAVMLLWNAIMPGLTGWALLTWPKALGLLVLCRLLFGGWHGRRGHGGPPWRRHAQWREKWNSLTEEQRAELRQRCQKRWGRWMPEEPKQA